MTLKITSFWVDEGKSVGLSYFNITKVFYSVSQIFRCQTWNIRSDNELVAWTELPCAWNQCSSKFVEGYEWWASILSAGAHATILFTNGLPMFYRRLHNFHQENHVPSRILQTWIYTSRPGFFLDLCNWFTTKMRYIHVHRTTELPSLSSLSSVGHHEIIHGQLLA